LRSAAPRPAAVLPEANSGRGRQHADPGLLERGKTYRSRYSRPLWHDSSNKKTASHANCFEQYRTCKIGQTSRPCGRLLDKSASNLSINSTQRSARCLAPVFLAGGQNRRGGEPGKARPPYYQSISSWQASSSRARSLFNRSFRSRSADPALS
jgi:hypothetical protein